MLERLGMLCRARSAPWIVFAAVFGLVFLLVVATSTIITFIIPESYASTARLVLRPAGDEAAQGSSSHAAFRPYDPYFVQTELEVIRSDQVLDQVIDELYLNAAWGKRYANGEKLRTPQTLAMLRARLDLRPVRNTSLIEIRVFSDEPSEAAWLANAIAESYRQLSSQLSVTENGGSPEHTRVQIVDRAVPGVRPVRPNKPLNIAIGIAIGMLVGLAAGAAMAVFVAWLGGRSRRTGPPPAPGPVPPPGSPSAGTRRPRNAFDKVIGSLWIGIGGALTALALVAVVWFLIFHQASVTGELLFLPFFGLCWAGNGVLGFFLLRGKRWARICLGVEGVLFLAYYGLRSGVLLPHSPTWVGGAILHVGWLIVGPLPQMLRWVFIALGIASICALLWPRKATVANVC